MQRDFTGRQDADAVIQRIRNHIEEHFSEKRRVHTYGVRDTALRLLERYGEPEGKAGPEGWTMEEKTEIAALFHDLYRGVPIEELNRQVLRFHLPERYLDQPNLAHGKVAALVMETEYGIGDKEVLSAVRFHTTGRAGMSLLEKILYVADGIEPSRAYPGVDALREVAEKSLNDGCLALLEHTIAFVKETGGRLDEDSLAAAEDLRREVGKENL